MAIHPSRALPARVRAAVALAAALVLALALPRAADAHTHLKSSRPASGATVGDTLSAIRLAFTKPVSPYSASVTLTLAGAQVLEGDLTTVPGSDGATLVLQLGRRLAPGVYTAAWRCAGMDGHVIRGTFQFTVTVTATATASVDTAHSAAAGPAGSAAVPAPPLPAARRDTAAASADAGEAQQSEAASPLAVAIRWAELLALLGAVGAVAFNLGVLRRMRGSPALAAVADRASYGAWHLAAAAAALSALSLMLRLWAQSTALYGSAHAFDGERLDHLLMGTLWGSGWILQAVATVAFFVGLLVARAPHGRSVGWMGAAVAALLLAAVPALSGHAASAGESAPLAIATDWLHVLGAGVWLGSLAVLLAAGLPAAALAGGGEAPAAFGAMVRAFSPVALAGSATAALTGIINALFHIHSFGDLFGTAYGRVLLLKLALLAGTAALGYHNWQHVLPGAGEPGSEARLRRSARMEISLGVLVILVTAVLVALPTP